MAKNAAFVVFTVCFLVSAAWVKMTKLTYEAAAVIQIDEPAPGPMEVRKTILGPRILERAVLRLNEGASGDSMSLRQGQLQNLRTRIQVRQGSGPGSFQIAAHDLDPQRAARTADSLAEVFRDYGLELKREPFQAQAALTSEQIREAELILADAEKAWIEAREKAARQPSRESLEGEREALRSEREELLKTYAAVHPEVKALDKRINDIEIQIAALPAKDPAVQSHLAFTEAEGRLKELHAKLNEISLEEAAAAGPVKILEKARVPDQPLGLPRWVLLCIGLAVSLALALLSAFLTARLIKAPSKTSI